MDGTEVSAQVVGIGASAGGIEALKTFFGSTPSDTGMAFLVVLHLAPDHHSLLAEILRGVVKTPVVQAEDGMDVKPDHIYVIAPGTTLTFADDKLAVHGHRELTRRPFVVDQLFSSLAVALGDKAVGIVLSGTGSDGALGLKAIHAAGGIALAQSPDAGGGPYFEGMPNAAIAIGAVDMCLPAGELPEHLLRLLAAPPPLDDDLPPPQEPAAEMESHRTAICAILRNRLGHDFSGYKPATFFRRVQRRMQLFDLGFDDYISYLSANPPEVELLFNELLIGVTRFFRDPETFDALARSVFPLLFAGRAPDSPVRVWVAGCSTGEEAYTLAILLIEHMDTLPPAPAAPPLQIFATDIDDAAVNLARAGRYPPALVRDIAPKRLQRFFTLVDGNYVIARQVRDLCTFSTHSVVRDPPFSRIDLISCRNLLIYLDTDLQAQVIPTFYYALSPGGVLLLGSSETVTRHEDLFTPLDKTHRIFQRRDGNARLPPRSVAPLRSVARQPASKPPDPFAPSSPGRGAPPWAKRARDRVLDVFAPPFVVVNGDGQVLQFSARTSQYLEQGSGAPTRDVLTMARHGLRPELRAALRQAGETGRRIDRFPVALAGEGAGRTVMLTVEPLDGGDERLFLVVFAETTPTQCVAPADAGPSDSRIEALEAELHETHKRMQAAMEESDGALEELTSTNEELHSVNEELQSANEELETSREEMQSMNEELHTVNAELAAKVDDLDRANNDIRNLFESTQVATIFLDRNLIVRSFTPAVIGIYNLIPSDRGRRLTDIACFVDGTRLEEDVPQVLETLTPLERRVVTRDGSVHYLKRVMPYRTADNTVDGVLITFMDITSVVEIEKQQLLVDELNHRVRNMLAVVTAMSGQTLRRSKTLKEFETVFVGRIDALAAAYTLVARDNWSKVSLREILEVELRPYVRSSNAMMQGPDVNLSPRAALVLGMAAHELATNAVHHGALSAPTGEVAIKWHIETGAAGAALVLAWEESGGPATAPPQRHGFGLTLLERSVTNELEGAVDLTFAERGLSVRFRMPLRHEIAFSGESPL